MQLIAEHKAGRPNHIYAREYGQAFQLVSNSDGYCVEMVADGLTYPTACELDEQWQLHVIEAGYSYGEVWTEPKLVRLDPGGKKTVIATGSKNGPWNGIAYHEGNFYVSEGGELEGGKILRISPEGKITALIENLPSFGDHHTNGPVTKDGYIYFGQGAATSSGVVGPDNASYGWLKRKPKEWYAYALYKRQYKNYGLR
jgi:hypothetical protein